jgi:hypothetical protein
LQVFLQAVVLDQKLDDALVVKWSQDVEAKLWPGDSSAKIDKAYPAIRTLFSTPKSIDFAIGYSVGNDIYLIAIAITVICLFTVLALLVPDYVFTRTSLAFLGILCVSLSISSGFGLALLLGIPFTTLTQVLPFILLGVGVDDLFVLVRSLEDVEESSPGLSLEQRFKQTLAQGGMAITVTSLTNVSAFLFGSMTSIPSITWWAPCSSNDANVVVAAYSQQWPGIRTQGALMCASSDLTPKPI